MACALGVPGVAYADSLTNQAIHLRREVVAKFGQRAAGRDIVRWNVPTRDGTTRKATRAELIAYRNTLARILAPPTPAPAGASLAQTNSGGSGNLPTCSWLPESGGNWNSVNPSSGAGGRYQIMPSTWAANGGTGLPQDASPAEQTRVAENIMRSQGPSAWTNC